MLVMLLERVPVALRGELSRWLTPVASGVHIGRVSALVRDELWALAIAKAEAGKVIQIWSCGGEPGYDLRVHGLENSSLVSLEGLPLIAFRDAAWPQAMKRFTRPAQHSTLDEGLGDFPAS